MAARSIASLSISFGMVSIPVRLYSATESATAIRFKLMGRGGAALRQQYVLAGDASHAEAQAPEASDEAAEAQTAPVARTAAAAAAAPAPRSEGVLQFPSRPARPQFDEAPLPAATPLAVERADMVKGYEVEPGRYVLFTADELKALAAESRQAIDIVAFIPQAAVDPIYYDKSYYLAPDKRGAKPYSLLLRAMQDTARVALGKWAWRGKEYVVQIRPVEGGMVLQQLLYADEVRRIEDLGLELASVADDELALAKKLIEQISSDAYDPSEFADEEKQRVLAAIERKAAGELVGQPAAARPQGGQVLDLMAALRASLAPGVGASADAAGQAARKPPRKAAKAAKLESTATAAPRRSGKR